MQLSKQQLYIQKLAITNYNKQKSPEFFGALKFIYCCVVSLLAQRLQIKDADFLPYSYILDETV